jgi:phage terminase large subunit
MEIELVPEAMMEDARRVITIPYGWSPREYQDEGWQYFQGGGKRACMCWHRRAGKDLFGINLIAKCMVQRPGLYWHGFPTYQQGRKIIWDGVTRDGRPFLDHFPGYSDPGGKNSLVETKRDDLMTLKLKPTMGRPSGGTYQVVGFDDPDRLVGANPFGVIFSEWSLIDPRVWHLIRPILNENGGWALFIFTMRGRNHAYKMLQYAKTKKHWFSQLLTVRDTFKLVPTNEKDEKGNVIHVPRPVITEEQIQEDRDEGMPEATIQSEYYGSADAPVDGAYYGHIITELEKEPGRIDGRVPHDPKALVHTFWDIGHDSTSIIFMQPIGRELHLIDFYENQGEGLPHYATVLKQRKDELGYNYGEHYGPHDLEQREWASGGKSKIDIARALGIKFHLVAKHSLEDGIEETRAMLKRVWIDSVACAHLIEALRAYHKDWDEKHQVFKELPCHDWASHPADAARNLAMGFKDKMSFRKKKIMNRAITQYNPFTI